MMLPHEKYEFHSIKYKQMIQRLIFVTPFKTRFQNYSKQLIEYE